VCRQLFHVLPADLRDRSAAFGLTQGKGDLLLREPLLHRDLLEFGTRKVSRKYNLGSVKEMGRRSTTEISRHMRDYFVRPIFVIYYKIRNHQRDYSLSQNDIFRLREHIVV
jgi:hypothetical protein